MLDDSFTISPSLGGKIVRPSKEALDADVIRELLTGEEFRRKNNERKREQQAYREAAEMKGHRTVAGLGKCIACIPQMEFIAISAKYGNDCWDDKSFIKDFQRRFPHLAPNRA
jgi:hypothetical protein